MCGARGRGGSQRFQPLLEVRMNPDSGIQAICGTGPTAFILHHTIAAPLMMQGAFLCLPSFLAGAALRHAVEHATPWNMPHRGTRHTSQQTTKESVNAELMSHQDQTTAPPSSLCCLRDFTGSPPAPSALQRAVCLSVQPLWCLPALLNPSQQL